MKKGTSSLAAYYVAALKGLEQEKSRLDEEIRQVRSLLARHAGGTARAATETSASSAVAKKPRKKRELSATARARIAAAQKKRWAEFRKKSPKG